MAIVRTSVGNSAHLLDAGANESPMILTDFIDAPSCGLDFGHSLPDLRLAPPHLRLAGFVRPHVSRQGVGGNLPALAGVYPPGKPLVHESGRVAIQRPDLGKVDPRVRRAPQDGAGEARIERDVKVARLVVAGVAG